MAAQMSVLGLILSFYPYLRSAMVRFPLWMPIKSTKLQAIEKLQKDFLNRIPSLRDINYWEKLKYMKFISLQRRLERHRIICTWKAMDGIVPNCGIEIKLECSRVGRKCKIPGIRKQAKKSIQTLRNLSGEWPPVV